MAAGNLYYFVDMSVLDEAIKLVSDEHTTLAGKLTEARGHLDGASTAWEGPAANSFKAEIAPAMWDFEQLVNAVGDLHDRMQYVRDNYHQTEQTNGWSFRDGSE